MDRPEVGPALAYRFAPDDARDTGTVRLRLRERRYRRRAQRRTEQQMPYLAGERNELAEWAAVRRVLAERGVDLPDA